MNKIKNDQPAEGVFPEKLMPAVIAEMGRILAMNQEQPAKMKKIFSSFIGRKVIEIRPEGGYDSRFNDVVIVFEDGSSLMIQGDFSLTELAADQSCNKPGFYNITKKILDSSPIKKRRNEE